MGVKVLQQAYNVRIDRLPMLHVESHRSFKQTCLKADVHKHVVSICLGHDAYKLSSRDKAL